MPRKKSNKPIKEFNRGIRLTKIELEYIKNNYGSVQKFINEILSKVIK